MSQLFASGGQSTGVSASTSVHPMNTEDWSPLGWTGWISLQPRDPEEYSPTPQFKSINSSVLIFLQSPTLSFIDKAREFQKNIYFCFIDYAKAFDCVDHNKLWKILKEKGIPHELTCLLRNLYSGQEAMVRTAHGTTDWFQIRKGVYRACILSS